MEEDQWQKNLCFVRGVEMIDDGMCNKCDRPIYGFGVLCDFHKAVSPKSKPPIINLKKSWWRFWVN